jgi:hypothetical protein
MALNTKNIILGLIITSNDSSVHTITSNNIDAKNNKNRFATRNAWSSNCHQNAPDQDSFVHLNFIWNMQIKTFTQDWQ